MSRSNSNTNRTNANRGSRPSKSQNSQKKIGKTKFQTGEQPVVQRGEVVMDKLTHNNPAYYNKNALDYNDTMAIPWFKIIGNRTGMEKAIPESLLEENGPGTSIREHKFPTIMAIDVVPSIGACDGSALNPVNKCFTMMFNELAAKTANANIGFQMPDLAMYLTSMSSVQSLIAYAKKVLGTTNFWRTKNISYPMALTSAHGFRWNEISQSRTNFVTMLNDLIRMFNSMRVPHFTEVFDRQYAMFNSVFVDEDDDFGQIYTFRPRGFYKYVDTEMKCVWTPCDYLGEASSSSFTRLLGEIEDALKAWYQSDDYRLINGALLRAYGDVPSYVIETATVDGDIAPTTDKYFLLQIMNMDIIPYSDLSNLDIAQHSTTVGGLITWQPICTNPALPSASMDHFLRIYNANVTLDDNCEMTRLCTVWQETADGIWTLQSSGTELIVGITLFEVDSSSFGGSSVARITSNFEYFKGNDNISSSALLQAFRYLPFLPVATSLSESDVSLQGCLGDIYNYTCLPNNVLSRMHEVALYSIWKPSIVAKVY